MAKFKNATLREEFNNFSEEAKPLLEELKNEVPKNIVSIFLPVDRFGKEGAYQYLLEYFLDPNGSHGFNGKFLSKLIELINEDIQEDYEVLSEVVLDTEVYMMLEGGEEYSHPIDLVIASDRTNEPDWMMFLELKVGAGENDPQTKNYYSATNCLFNGREIDLTTNKINKHFLYLCKSSTAKNEPEKQAENSRDGFLKVEWAQIINKFCEINVNSIGNYPLRSGGQFLDFISSLKEEENMGEEHDQSENEKKLSNLYLNYSNEIDQAKNAFNQVFEEFKDYEWGDYVRGNFKLKGEDGASSWGLQEGSKFAKIRPEFWCRGRGSGSGICVAFEHRLKKDKIKNSTLKFGLRLPSGRPAHQEVFDSRFREAFKEKIESKDIDLPNLSLDSSGYLFYENFDLDFKDTHEDRIDPFDNYLKKLSRAIQMFCSNPKLIN